MDPIANMITGIKNGYMARKRRVDVPYSKIKENIAKKLADLGFLESVNTSEDKKHLQIQLLYRENTPAVTEIKRVSKPSLRIYSPSKNVPYVLSGRGEVILSTPKGILAGREARKSRTGGELILKIW